MHSTGTSLTPAAHSVVYLFWKRCFFRSSKPMTHFSTKMLEQGPERLARELEDELGFRVLAAYDGWLFEATTEIAAASAA